MTKAQVVSMIELAKREQAKGEPWLRISPQLALELFEILLEVLDNVSARDILSSTVPHTPGTPKS